VRFTWFLGLCWSALLRHELSLPSFPVRNQGECASRICFHKKSYLPVFVAVRRASPRSGRSTFFARVSVLAFATLVGAILSEAEFGENVGDPDFGAVRLFKRGHFQRMLKHLGDTHIPSLTEPFHNRLFPHVGLETQCLFGGSECL